jgi:DNA-binding LytR/AlgR family response regulator
MSLASPPVSPSAPHLSTGRWTAVAFVYWVLFMGALTPGNLADGFAAGISPNWPQEIVRLLGAGGLGAAVTPLLLVLARRFPPTGAWRWRNLAIQALSVAALAPALVLVSCFLAAWAFDRQFAPTRAEVGGQMLANGALLVFCLALLLAVIQVLPRLASARPPTAAGWAERLTIGERGRLRVIDLSTVDWIESQGNYQALHSGDEVHLFRDTSKGLAAKLDPGQFVRIHRRFIVAADRVRDIEPLANGDATVRLANGVALRQSRHHRNALRAHLLGRAPG